MKKLYCYGKVQFMFFRGINVTIVVRTKKKTEKISKESPGEKIEVITKGTCEGTSRRMSDLKFSIGVSKLMRRGEAVKLASINEIMRVMTHETLIV